MDNSRAKKFLAELTVNPGVYQFIDGKGQVLYVGKAKNLKSRVSSYFREKGQSIKTQALMARVEDVQVAVTASETEALLLEQNLIKSLKPPYNILLRDDKSYPYIFLTDKAPFPAVGMHRGSRRKNVSYFGPFPNATSVRQTLNILQKAFKVRQCDDSYFKNRSRPCLQHQINRCLAPCVLKQSGDEYQAAVRHTRMFLEGRERELNDELLARMDDFSSALEFEAAAEVRDQIVHLRRVQEKQHVDAQAGDADVIAGVVKPIGVCVQVLFVRGGRILGSRSYFPKGMLAESVDELVSAFVAQFYLRAGAEHSPPAEIIVNADLTDKDLLRQVLADKARHSVRISTNVRGHRARWLESATTNAEQNLLGNHAIRTDYHARIVALRDILDLDREIQRMECFDISHSSGEATVASCVVFDNSGPKKADYRRFNIKDIQAGDDYAAMEQALQRRYKRLREEEGSLPDLLLVDGGKGQLRIAEDCLAALGIDSVVIVGVAKGTTRKPGLESLYVAGRGDEIVIGSDSPALHLIQHIRDEAHRFAITSHRQSRGKARKTSTLESIPGIGASRRRALLRHFGGLQELSAASADEIAKVPGISRNLAVHIYASLH